MNAQLNQNLPFFYNQERQNVYPNVGEQDKNTTIFKDEIIDNINEINEIAKKLEGKRKSKTKTQTPQQQPLQQRQVQQFPQINVGNIQLGDNINQYGIGNQVNRNQYNQQHNYNNGPQEKKEKDGTLLRLVVGAVFAVVLGISSYVGGRIYKDFHFSNKNLHKVREIKDDFVESCEATKLLGKDISGKKHEHAQLIYTTYLAAEKALYNVRKNAIINGAITATIVAGAAIATIGAVAASPAAMAGGGIVTGAGCAAALFKWGAGCLTKSENKKLINKIHKQTTKINNCQWINTEKELWFPPRTSQAQA